MESGKANSLQSKGRKFEAHHYPCSFLCGCMVLNYRIQLLHEEVFIDLPLVMLANLRRNQYVVIGGMDFI